MRYRTGLLCLLASLFVMAPTAMAQDALPDLMAVVVDANQGAVEIRNIGQGAAKPGQVYIVCSRFDSTTPSTPCATGLNLPDYIKKWNVLSYDIPALQPGGKYELHLFGSGALPRKAGNYGMKITVDPIKHIAESDEKNNYTRLDTTIKAKKATAVKAAEKLPDLLLLMANADQGIVRIQNNGTAPAPASTLVASCKVYDSRGTFMHACTARTYLPNFDANRLLLNYDIPALKPGQSHEIHLFGSDAWPDRPGRYHLEVVADFDKQVAEISEANNSTSFTSLHAANDSKKGTTGRSPRPDLIPVARDPFFGIVYIENLGDTTAGKSKLLMTCNQADQNGGCATSPAMERIYDPALGGFVMNVPPIPAGKVHRVLFPMSGLTWDRGKYTFGLRADASGAVAETREYNNSVSRTLQWDTGILRIAASSNGKPAPVTYSIEPSGDRSRIPNDHLRKIGMGVHVQTPVDISLPTGEYQLGIQLANSHGVKQYFNVEVKAGTVFAQKVTFQQPGLLNITILGDNDEKISRISYSINLSGKSQYHVAAEGGGSEPAQVSLLPGSYDLHVYLKLSRFHVSPFHGSGASTMDSSLVMGADEQQVIRGIQIKSGQTIEKKIVFKHVEAGILSVHILSDGKPNQAYINVSLAKKGAPILFSFESPTQMKLMPGRYKLTVHPSDTRGSGSFQNARYGIKDVEVAIHAGETIEKHLAFTKAEKGTLAVTVLVNGSRSKAEIGIRKAGRKGRFSAVGATYNFLTNKADFLPGRYDISIHPLKLCVSPGGVDVFHGGVSGPGLRTRRLPDVKPVILHNVEIKPGERLKKTVEFKGVTRYTKVCM